MRGSKVKKYVKPELFYEFYELSQHIADCAWELKNWTDVSLCEVVPDLDKFPYLTPEDKLFADFPVCTRLREDFEDFCYQNGSALANLFVS